MKYFKLLMNSLIALLNKSKNIVNNIEILFIKNILYNQRLNTHIQREMVEDHEKIPKNIDQL